MPSAVIANRPTPGCMTTEKRRWIGMGHKSLCLTHGEAKQMEMLESGAEGDLSQSQAKRMCDSCSETSNPSAFGDKLLKTK